MAEWGEILLAEGVLAPDQLDEALEAQALYGGGLDTCLLELGLCGEDAIERAIEQALGTPATIDPHREEPRPEALALLSRLEALRYQLVPYRVTGRTLDVLCRAPLSLHALDAAAFKTGLRLRPTATTELRLAIALERYYGVRRPPRLAALPRSAATAFSTSGSSAPATRPTEPAVPAIEPARPSFADRGARIDFVPEALDEPAREFAPSAAPTRVRALAAALRALDDRDRIPEIFLPFLLQHLRRAALFQVQRGHALGWDAAGPGVDGSRVRTMAFPLHHPSVFQEAAEGDLFIGALPDGKLNSELARRMGEPRLAEICVMPIRIRSKVVTLVLGECDNEPALERAFTPLCEGCLQLGRTFARLILLRKKARAA